MQDTIRQNQQAMPDTTYARPGVPRRAVLLLIVWSALEGMALAFAVRPTISELVGDLGGFTVPPIVLVPLLGAFLTIIVAGSFACIQELNEAFKTKEVGKIVSMTIVQIVVALFEVLFLFRALVDATVPWLAQQGVTLGATGTLALASLGWVAVRGMTWYLFGRAGAPALTAVLNRYAGTRR